ncbi:MAG: hypothetical protein QXE64_00650 [Candidatus Pacearchaeota archaeon]
MPKEQRTDIESFLTQLMQRINEIEERENTNKNKIDMLSSSMLERGKRTDESIRLIREELRKLAESIEKISQRVDYIIAEMPNLARKEDLSSIERFIALWQPLQFATLEDVDRAIARAIEKIKEENA